MSQHTWHASAIDDPILAGNWPVVLSWHVYVDLGNYGYTVAYLPRGDDAERNARLIAASPDLLEACRAVEAATAPYRGPDASPEQTYLVSRDAIAAVRAAIAKATGQ